MGLTFNALSALPLRNILVKPINNYTIIIIIILQNGQEPRRKSIEGSDGLTVAVSQSVTFFHAEVQLIRSLLRHGIAGAKPLS